jgi:hypothetical protein
MNDDVREALKRTTPAAWRIALDVAQRYGGITTPAAAALIAQTHKLTMPPVGGSYAAWLKATQATTLYGTLFTQNAGIAKYMSALQAPSVLSAIRATRIPTVASSLISNSMLSPRFRELAQRMFRDRERLRQAYDGLVDRGWLPPDSWRGIFVFAQGDEPIDVDVVERHLVMWLRKYVGELVTEALARVPASCDSWKKAASEALDVHNLGKYFAAAPTWIIAAQGIARELSGDPHYELFQFKSEEHTRRRLERLSTVAAGNKRLVRMVVDISRSTSHADPNVPTRAGVVHAADPSYGTLEVSLKYACFLVALIQHVTQEGEEAA